MHFHYDKYRNYVFEKEDETIQSFGETPVVYDTTPKEIDDTEDEIEEKEEEDQQYEEENKDDENLVTEDTEISDDEALQYLPFEELNRIQFIPRFDYDSEDNVTVCSTCNGTEDAGDVAIIDSEIEETTINNENEEASEVDMTEEFRAFKTLMEKDINPNKFMFGSTEGFAIDTFGGLLYAAIKDLVISLTKVVGYLATKVFRLGLRVYKFSRNVIMRITLHKETIARFWNFKLERRLEYIDVERLNEYTVSAFPYDRWVQISRLAISMFDMLSNSSKIIFDSSKIDVTNTLKQVENVFDKTGIKLNVVKNTINVDDLMDKKQHLTISELGYTRDKMTSLMRYFKDIASRTEKGSLNKLKGEVKNIMSKINVEAAEANELHEEYKESKKYKDKQERVVNLLLRLDYCLCIMKLCYMLFDELTNQLLRVCDKYELALTPSKMLD